jgi:hypothetical protein
MNPGNPDPVADFEPVGSGSVLYHPANDLVPRRNRQTRRRCSPLDFIKLGMADTASRNFYKDFADAGYRLR